MNTHKRKRRIQEYNSVIQWREDVPFADKVKYFTYGFFSAVLLMMYLLVYGFTLPGY